MTYGTDRQGSVPPYSVCSPILFTQASHRCLPSVGIGSAWANWLAYNMGMVCGFDLNKFIFNQCTMMSKIICLLNPYATDHFQYFL